MLKLDGERFLADKEASNKYGLSVHWFRRARYIKKGPPYIKMNGRILYRESSLDEWFKRRTYEIENEDF